LIRDNGLPEPPPGLFFGFGFGFAGPFFADFVLRAAFLEGTAAISFFGLEVVGGKNAEMTDSIPILRDAINIVPM
jgi:hypothetical protein